MSWSWKGKSICDNCEKYPCSDDETKLMRRCPAFSPRPTPMTHGDAVRAMTDEELAATEMLCPYWASKNPWRCPEKYAKRKGGKEGYDCVACVLDWLKSPVEVDNG